MSSGSASTLPGAAAMTPPVDNRPVAYVTMLNNDSFCVGVEVLVHSICKWGFSHGEESAGDIPTSAASGVHAGVVSSEPSVGFGVAISTGNASSPQPQIVVMVTPNVGKMTRFRLKRLNVQVLDVPSISMPATATAGAEASSGAGAAASSSTASSSSLLAGIADNSRYIDPVSDIMNKLSLLTHGDNDDEGGASTGAGTGGALRASASSGAASTPTTGQAKTASSNSTSSSSSNSGGGATKAHVPSWTETGYSKLNIWSLVQFRRLVYLDADMMIVGPGLLRMFELDLHSASSSPSSFSSATSNSALSPTSIASPSARGMGTPTAAAAVAGSALSFNPRAQLPAAAPDIFPPDRFNAGEHCN